jgi:prevent-host-death family protein
MTVMSSRDFNQNASGAKRAASKEPVFITDRGKASHVLLSIEEYMKLAKKGLSVAESFYVPGADEIELDIPELGDFGFKPVDFS